MGTTAAAILWSSIASAAIGAGSSAYTAHEQSKQAKKQAQLQEESNKKAESIAAGRAQVESQQDNIKLAQAGDEAMRGYKATLLSRLKSSKDSTTKFGGAV